jgi:hypothetical protein
LPPPGAAGFRFLSTSEGALDIDSRQLLQLFLAPKSWLARAS